MNSRFLALLITVLFSTSAYAVLPPIANTDNDATLEDNGVTTDVLANDDDQGELDILSVTPQGVTATANGSFSCSAADCTYTPTANYFGNDSYGYEVCDNEATPLCDSTGVVNIVVNSVNDLPVASNQTLPTNEDVAVVVTMTGSDPVEGSGLSYSINSGPLQGSLGSVSGSNVTYTPGANFNGQDSFTFIVNDGSDNSSAATVTINVAPINDAPTANPQTVGTPEDTAVGVTLTGSDPENSALSFSVVSFPSRGVLSGTAPNLTYTPNAGVSGQDTFTFRVNDGNLNSPTATVTINVSSVNDAPTANSQTVATPEDTAVGITLTGSDPENSPLTFAIGTGPTQGTLTGTAPNLTYTPNAGVSGSDSFTFTVNDGELTSPAATVNINVSSVNDAPTANDQTVATPEDTPVAITLTGSDPDNDALSFAIVSGPSIGVLSGTAPNLTYTPNAGVSGMDSFTFTVNDGQLTSAAATVTINVSSVNDAPTANSQAVVTAEDIPIAITLTASDPEASPLTYAIVSGPSFGVLSGVAPDVTYTPNLDFNGADSFTFGVHDGELPSAPATVSISVTEVNDLPVVITPIGPQDAVEGAFFSINISGNFADADGEALVFTAFGLPASGNISISQQGVISGTPRIEDTDPIAVYDVTVRATDGSAAFIEDVFQLTISALDRANVSLSISAAPDPAMVNDQLVWTFTARNAIGPQTATNVELAGSFAGIGITVTESGGSNCAIQAEVNGITDFQCMMGALPVAGTSSIIINTATTAAGDVYVYASAATTDLLPIDPNPADNEDQMAVGVAQSFSGGEAQILGNATVRSVAAGDLDGDGMADLVVGTGAGQPVQIYLSGGFRDFVIPAITISDTASNEGIAIADFDGNGTLDVAVANGGGQTDKVYSNDGTGHFTPMATLPGSTFSQGIAVGDFNNDNRMDIAVATIQGNPVFLGNGNGGFNLHATLGNANSHDVAVARFDANGRDDLVFANVDGNSVVWTKNSGNGFTARAQILIGDASSVTVGEFGGDARPDLAFGRVPSGNGDVPANPVLINDGTGRFAAPFVWLGAAPTNDIHTGDVNDDSLDDLVFINDSGVHQIWSGNGGGFDLHSEQIVDDDSTVGVVTDLGMTDVGDPGGVDLAMGGAASAGLGVFLNDGFGNLGKGDVVPPVLTLVGDVEIEIAHGANYNDAGATADDNIDGPINSSRIVVNNPVNTSSVGLYTVTYNVSDVAGNAAVQISRTVNVLPDTGSGGSGGGSISPFALILLMFSVLFTTLIKEMRRRHAIIPVGHSKQ